jgi:hypothetical protein
MVTARSRTAHRRAARRNGKTGKTRPRIRSQPFIAQCHYTLILLFIFQAFYPQIAARPDHGKEVIATLRVVSGR